MQRLFFLDELNSSLVYYFGSLLLFPAVSLVVSSLYCVKKRYKQLFAFFLLVHFWLIFFLLYLGSTSYSNTVFVLTSCICFFVLLYCFFDHFSSLVSFSVAFNMALSFVLLLLLYAFSYAKLGEDFDLSLSFIGLFVFNGLRILYFFLRAKVSVYLSQDTFPSFLHTWTYLCFMLLMNSILMILLGAFWRFDYIRFFQNLPINLSPFLWGLCGMILFPYGLWAFDYLVEYLFSKLFSISAGYSYRAQTLKVSLKWIFRILFIFIFSLILLAVWSINISTVSWNLSVMVALAGLGFKGIIDDFMNGICVLIEDSVNIGEFIHVDNTSGRVEDVTLRVIKLRNFDGSLYVIPFRRVDVIRNRSKEFVYVVFDIMVDNKIASTQVLAWLKDSYSLFKESKSSLPYLNDILEDLEVIGIQSVNAAGVSYEVRLKIFPSNTRFIKAAYLTCLKDLANEREIVFGYEHSVLAKNPD